MKQKFENQFYKGEDVQRNCPNDNIKISLSLKEILPTKKYFKFLLHEP